MNIETPTLCPDTSPVPQAPSDQAPTPSPADHGCRYRVAQEHLRIHGLFQDGHRDQWRIARRPFPLRPNEVAWFEQLGNQLLAFYRALNRLYWDSVKGHQPPWIYRYLDQGKPESLLAFARMNRFRTLLPDVIRPDIIPTDTGMIMTELDSVPGGMGITGSLAQLYGDFGDEIVGGPRGLPSGFAAMLRHRAAGDDPAVAIVVSDEAEDYRTEMQWLTRQLQQEGVTAACVHPRELAFREHGLFLPHDFGDRAITTVYRFFELFDLPNIPKHELLMYSAKKATTTVTPPYKPWLEEKLAFALFHQPTLEPFWRAQLTDETFDALTRLIPHTWVLDPAPIPPMGVIPGLRVDGVAVADWRTLGTARQKARQYVLKPSGFSDLAWGSRGVVIGHDMPQQAWATAIDAGLQAFETTPYVLQDFHKGRQFSIDYFDTDAKAWTAMEGRVRLSPYYYVQDTEAKLTGILATVCPKNKKIIHGMHDAIMVPCGVSRGDGAAL